MDFTLRPFGKADADSVAKYANNAKIAAKLRNVFPHPYSKADARAFIESCVKEEGERQMIRAICIGGEAVGSIGIFPKEDVHEQSAELGYWLGEPFWNQGIITKAIGEICAQAFARYDIVRIYAEPFAENAGSRRVLEKAGFSLEGVMKKSVLKNGKLQDSCLYAFIKEESHA